MGYWPPKEIVGIQRATYVNVGYQVDETWTGIRSVSLACRRGATVLWAIPIADPIESFMFDHEGNATEIVKPVVIAIGKEHKRNG
jgi:hypothetical protein